MSVHEPVLLQETLHIFKPSPGQTIIDATFGGGGHSIAFASKGAQVIALDRDLQAVREGESLLAHACLARQQTDGGPRQTFLFPHGGSVILYHLNFRNLKNLNLSPVDGILFDLGISSDQLASDRGFSFQKDSPLDMRFDPDHESATAADLLNALSQRELAELFTAYADEPQAQKIAKKIVQQRQTEKFRTTDQLVSLIASVKPTRGKIHPATQVFQALRMAVNTEPDDLRKGLEAAWEALKSQGKIVVISFHSGEDRIVKQFAQKLDIKLEDPITPALIEISQNPRSRSAKLRTLVKN